MTDTNERHIGDDAQTVEEWLEAQRINGGPHGFEAIGVEKLGHLWRAAEAARSAS